MLRPPQSGGVSTFTQQEHGGNQQLLLQTWALGVLRDGCRATLAEGEAEVSYVEMEKRVLALRRSQSQPM